MYKRQPKTSAALISIVQEIRKLNPDAQIILIGYTNPVPLIPCWRSYFSKLNKFEKQIAKTYDLTYVAIPNTETTLDVHPTIKGHAYIANKLVNAIENPERPITQSPRFQPEAGAFLVHRGIMQPELF